MKKLLTLAAAFCVASSTAMADDFYAAINYAMGKGKQKLEGKSVGNVTLKKSTPMLGDIAVGTYLTPNIRTELALSLYRGSSSAKDQTLKVKQSGMGGMLNFYYDFTPTQIFTPYVVGGLGYVRNKFKFTGSKITSASKKAKAKGSFAYQAGIGVDVAATDTVKFGLGYRYRSLGSGRAGNNDLYNGEAVKTKIAPVHMVTIGTRMDF